MDRHLFNTFNMEVKRLLKTSQSTDRAWLVATIPEFSYKHLLHGGYMASANLSRHRKYLHALISYNWALGLTSSNSKSWSCRHHIIIIHFKSFTTTTLCISNLSFFYHLSYTFSYNCILIISCFFNLFPHHLFFSSK